MGASLAALFCPGRGSDNHLRRGGIDVWEFDQTWIWLSILLYVVALGIAHSVLIPSHRRSNQLSATLASGQGGAAEAAELEAVAKKMPSAGATANLLAVIIIFLMVWKPGV